MLNKKLNSLSESKLSKTLTQITEGGNIEKTGFIKSSNKSSLFKTKSFRLREADFVSLSTITTKINNSDERMSYSDSQVIRGIINYISDNMDNNLKKLLPYIKSSS
jgi:hypothetical protein